MKTFTVYDICGVSAKKLKMLRDAPHTAAGGTVTIFRYLVGPQIWKGFRDDFPVTFDEHGAWVFDPIE